MNMETLTKTAANTRRVVAELTRDRARWEGLTHRLALPAPAVG